MQVTETSNDGLKRQLKVVVPSGDLGKRFEERLGTLKDQAQIKGFRKGKVPIGHLKKLYGRQIMAEVLQQALDESSRQALEDRNERPALQPEIALTEDEGEIEKILSGAADLAYTMSFEILPDIKLVDLATLDLEREKAEVGSEDIDKAIADLATRNVAYEPDEARAAEDGDQLKIDFVGKIDGEAFEGGSGEDLDLVIGQGGFIPGFEDGLKGTKAGDEKAITAKFPEAYPVDTLKGKEAVFEVKVRQVAKPVMPEINEEFAKGLGAESLDQLKEMVSGQISREFDMIGREKLKRQILDKLDTAHAFELPPTLVEQEFDGVWKQVTEGLQQSGKSFADEGKTEEGAREEYKKLAERRVRLGLVLGEIGRAGKIEVTEDDMRMALIQRARSYPGQEKFVYEYYQKNPSALAELRAPIFEEKVVDHVIASAKPKEKVVSRDELLKDPNADEVAAGAS